MQPNHQTLRQRFFRYLKRRASRFQGDQEHFERWLCLERHNDIVPREGRGALRTIGSQFCNGWMYINRSGWQGCLT